MLQVKTKLDKSSIHGIGLFADQFIPKGTIIFKESNLTVKFELDQYDSFDGPTKEYIKHYCYLLGDVWRCSLDNDRFMNHSSNPNTEEPSHEITLARFDIYPGEEITCDYNKICEDYKSKIKSYE